MQRPESELHPHVPEERPEAFRSWSGGSTEIEYRNLVVAVADCLKPRRALETGVFHPWGLPPLAAVCERLDVLDSDPKACASVRGLGLPNLHAHCTDASQWIASQGSAKFDFAFLDTYLPVRAKELRLLLTHDRLTSGAVVMIHDTSRVRVARDGARDPESVEFWRQFDALRSEWPLQVLEMPLSRGMLLIQKA